MQLIKLRVFIRAIRCRTSTKFGQSRWSMFVADTSCNVTGGFKIFYTHTYIYIYAHTIVISGHTHTHTHIYPSSDTWILSSKQGRSNQSDPVAQLKLVSTVSNREFFTSLIYKTNCMMFPVQLLNQITWQLIHGHGWLTNSRIHVCILMPEESFIFHFPLPPFSGHFSPICTKMAVKHHTIYIWQTLYGTSPTALLVEILWWRDLARETETSNQRNHHPHIIMHGPISHADKLSNFTQNYWSMFNISAIYSNSQPARAYVTNFSYGHLTMPINNIQIN